MVLFSPSNNCKRWRLSRIKGPRDRKQTASISYIEESNGKSSPGIQPAEFTLPPPPKSFSADSPNLNPDSTRSLLSTKETLSSSKCLVLPSIYVSKDSFTIPTIYINSTCTTSSA
ncbi:hypothetical protein CEXT_702371 [Caerostris extrusa]|uniref:Uncharacterized protein n=1 Tax=Caerostris extrusa TaxID=172846 RepID=A0AAV4NB02_CAEEX|nr:hypothetical protein CEXT_702371 [Caerostris extrusa]